MQMAGGLATRVVRRVLQNNITLSYTKLMCMQMHVYV